MNIPNAAAAAYPAQAGVDSGDVRIITAAGGLTGVAGGCIVAAQATPNMTVQVIGGRIRLNGASVFVPFVASVAVAAANATNPRHDLVTADANGAVAVITGTPAAITTTAEPVFPTIPANRVVLAAIYVPPAVTAITNPMITDKRVIVPGIFDTNATRDTFWWPFTVDSPWNLPLANTATFEAAADTRTANFIATSTTAGTINAWITYTGYNMPFTRASYTDPLATMTDTGDAARSDVYRIPATAAIATGTDGPMGIVTPDGRFLHETWQTHRTNSTTYTTAKHVKSDLHGRGIGPGQGIHANGSSIAGGVIREWEVYGGPEGYGEIRHALALGLDGSQLYYAGGGYGIDGYQRGTLTSGYVWPAAEQDFDSPTSYTGQVPMGSLAAIPPWVDLTTLGLSPSGLVIARAIQRFGLYVVDRTSLTWGLVAEESIASSRWNDWLNPALSDVGLIRAQCRLVKNNSRLTPGGGVWTGDATNRVAPLAPPLPPTPYGRPS